MGVDETNGAISRREALKTTAKAAGMAAFVAPVVVGVFSAPAVRAATCNCSVSTDSDAVPATIDPAGITRNTNCGNGDGPNGAYNAQNISFNFGPAQGGSIQIGLDGVDNFGTEVSFYTIASPAGWCCEAEWIIEGQCSGAVATSVPAVGAPAGAQPLPYCVGDCSGVKLTLTSVTCCPI